MYSSYIWLTKRMFCNVRKIAFKFLQTFSFYVFIY